MLSRRTKVGASGILTISFCAASALDRAVCRSAKDMLSLASTFNEHGLAGPCAVLDLLIGAPNFSCCLVLQRYHPTGVALPEIQKHMWIPLSKSAKQNKGKQSRAM